MMPSPHDELQIMNTEEILNNNIHNLQEQLTHASKRVAYLAETLGSIIAIHRDLEYHLQGIDIYIDDIKKLIDEGSR
tara:strand:+ start:464 stop:694 length:231 start_codon:yes stop_codon:yes gene_type:complete